MKSIYKKYMERLIEISGRSRSLYMRSITKKYSFDLGRLLEGNGPEAETFLECLWQKRRKPYKLLCEETKKGIVKNLKESLIVSPETAQLIFEKELSAAAYLKREIDEIEKETGRYELFVGYPFVRGWLNRDTLVRAPLFLFPARIITDGKTVEIELNHSVPVQLNKAFLLAYSKEYGINIDALQQEFEDIQQSPANSVQAAVSYLKGFGFKLRPSGKKTDFTAFDDTEPRYGETLEICNYAVLGRFPLASSIYNDYIVLERDRLSSGAIDSLLLGRPEQKSRQDKGGMYLINRLDYAQENAIEMINRGGNIVLYGPPGTGKSQTIVNVVSDAICKGKRVLVVSQKRAALDVVFNRLGVLNRKAMLVLDPDKCKAEFFKTVLNAHNEVINRTPNYETLAYEASVSNLNEEIRELTAISDLLFTPTPFGISLQQMYAQSYPIGKEGMDYRIFEAMQKNKRLMRMDYPALSAVMKLIREKNKGALYVEYLEARKNNPLVAHLRPNLDVHKLNEAKTFIQKAIARTIQPFDTASYPHSRYILTYYLEHKDNNKYALRQYAKLVAKLEAPALSKLHTFACIPPFWPLLIYTAPKVVKARDTILHDFDNAIRALRTYVEEYALLQLILDDKGFALTLDAIANGNNAYLKKLYAALEEYVALRDAKNNIDNLTSDEIEVFRFATEVGGNKKGFLEALSKILAIRVYIEVIKEEKEKKQELSKLMLFNDVREHVLALKKEQRHLVREMAFEKASKEYVDYYRYMDAPERAESDGSSKNFLHQISKTRGMWPIRRLMDYFRGFLQSLFPCWLLSPEAVSVLLPLQKEMFDIILFDEASQLYIESTIPTIYRGKCIVVAGDNKQLRPTASFIKRYLGAEENGNLPLNEQAALEVESLLDLATTRYSSTNLTYHYRSRYEELINFSNYAFYDGRLQIAPNIEKKQKARPIERIMVKGQWSERRNHEEAQAVVDLVKKILRTRENNETIGIVTFNMEQKEYIEDLLDREALRNNVFKKQYFAERNRVEHGEDLSIFVKNLENVQGDERDIIIFSVGYSRNESDKVFTHFGSLSVEGGENRLNVAITRAKQKIYVITSIEPEELNVENSKNIGPKLLKKYLQYVRAVSTGDRKEIKAILASLCAKKDTSENLGSFETQLKAELTKLGYKVDTLLGNADYKISLGIFDEELGEYILGIECDYAAYESSLSVLERDVYRPKFLESRGWTIMRVWSRDWWMTKSKVIASIERAVKHSKKLRQKQQIAQP